MLLNEIIFSTRQCFPSNDSNALLQCTKKSINNGYMFHCMTEHLAAKNVPVLMANWK